jgi:hypothetical protein
VSFLRILLGWAFVAAVCLAIGFTYLAGRHMSSSVSNPFVEFNFRSGIFGPRFNFSEQGWRYRQLALGTMICVLVLFMLFLLL